MKRTLFGASDMIRILDAVENINSPYQFVMEFVLWGKLLIRLMRYEGGKGRTLLRLAGFYCSEYGSYTDFKKPDAKEWEKWRKKNGGLIDSLRQQAEEEVAQEILDYFKQLFDILKMVMGD